MIFKNRFAIFFFVLIIINVNAQEHAIDDISEYTHTASPEYIDAIKVYEKVIEDGKLEDEDLFIKIARAYYFSSDYTSAIKWFEKYYNIYDIRPLPIYNYWYGQSLKADKKFKKADSLLAPYFESRGERYKYASVPEKKMDTLTINTDRYEMLPFENNSEFSDYPAYLHQDRLYFITNLQNKKSGLANTYTSDIFFAEDSELVVQTPKGELNSDFNEGSLVISRNGKTMYFTRNSFLNNNRYAKKRSKKDKERIITLNIFRAELIDGEWQNITPLSINNLEYSVAHPALSLDEKTLYFSSNMPGGKGYNDLYSVEIKDNDKLGKPKNLEALNTIGKEMFPFVDPRNGNLVFASDRATSLGGLDVYIAPITSKGTYKDAYNLGEPVNSTYDDFAYVVNKSQKGYFSSNRDGKEKRDEIYSFFETKPFSFVTYIAVMGVITDIETKVVLDNAAVSLYDTNDQLLETVATDAEGRYQFEDHNVDNISYIKVEKDDYSASEITLDPKEIAKKNATLNIRTRAKKMGQRNHIKITGRIKDKNSKNSGSEGIANAKITLFDIDGNTISTKNTDDKGDFNYLNIDRRNVAFMRVEKDGYLTEENAINGFKVLDGVFNLDTELLTSKVYKKQGADIASILNTIYFDTGSNEIRNDAKLELEKIVQVLHQYSDVEILIGSHTDSRSSASFNQELSQKRAKATYDYIIGRGISSARLSFKGYGESELLNECEDGIKCPEEKHQLNRRSTFTIRK